MAKFKKGDVVHIIKYDRIYLIHGIHGDNYICSYLSNSRDKLDIPIFYIDKLGEDVQH